MESVMILLFFALGLLFGSFFNVVGLRVPKKIPFANDRSRCPNCDHQLAWYDNIPLLSFAIQRGKCRYCRKPISSIYPVVEALTGVLFALSYMQIGLNKEIVTALLLVSLLMIILVSDLAYMLIPNKVLLFFLPFLAIMRFLEPLEPWWSSLVGAIAALVIIALVIMISRGGMGAGDMKLFGVLGIVLGLQGTLLAFFLSCIIGAIVGLLLIVLKVIDRKQPVPFGPYIVLASLITYFSGERLIDWYITIL
ncbi:prepilin peptidase [Oceanobacillus picturae]|uniref:prepilin peptidase n=1 Tax=Oceanobacillus picturae TaxID=171693 RepID=UPI000E678D2C|nr:A24 family peptidase [Oceanobacillus picturae]RIU89726.1 prepilin peptidase [Oceanobacillus picturae]